MVRKIVFGLLACSLVAGQASAQNWSFDARKIGLGSPGGDENLATQMIDEARNYGSVVLPFGLFQVMHDFDKLKPTNDQFDLIRTMEYAASPLHYTFGRDKTDSGSRFVEDIRNAALHRDLNYYRGFVPANQPPAEGLAAPNWGRTIKIARGPGGAFQGVYVGAGPYLSMRSDFSIDQPSPWYAQRGNGSCANARRTSLPFGWIVPGYSLHASGVGQPSQWTTSSTRERSTMRWTGGVIAATSRPWYLRVLSEGMVDDAYPPRWLAISHSRRRRSSSRPPCCPASVGVIAIPP